MKFKKPVTTETVVQHLRVCGLTPEEISGFIQVLDKLRATVGDVGEIKGLSISVNGGSDDDVDDPKEHPSNYHSTKSTYVSKDGETTVYFKFKYL